MYEMLEKVNSPEDIKNLNYDELSAFCSEVRSFLVDKVSKTGGHLASNLGTVELTTALHRVFNTPHDSIVWDVGHQCYTHKIITGRKDKFDTLRQLDGLSGFPKPSESIHDVSVSGHSSTSVSTAFAISRANQLDGNNNYAVAVIGDGAFTGGMAYEALNNAGRSKSNLVIVLNHNSMSISKNVGALSKYLSRIRLKPGYLRLKGDTKTVLDHIPLVGRPVKKAVRSLKTGLKDALYHSTFFEEMGFTYIGPVDGHDIKALEEAFSLAKTLKRPSFIQVVTVKGKGYEYAEKNPMAYHGVGVFDVETGNPDISHAKSFSAVFGGYLKELADNDDKICAITAAMKEGTGLNEFALAHRNRFFDVGIAEQHAVTFASGLAIKGFIPVFAVYSTFLQRAYDQIIHDAAIAKLHIVLAVDRAGIVGDDGETHQGVYDVAFLTSIPGVTVFSPTTNNELKALLNKAIYETDGVVAVRYPKGTDCGIYNSLNSYSDYEFIDEGKKVLAISYGRVFNELYKAREGVTVLKLNKIYPFSEELLKKISEYENIVFFEETIENGSVCEHLLSALCKLGYKGEFKAHTLPNDFFKQGKIPEILKEFKLDEDSIKDILREELKD